MVLFFHNLIEVFLNVCLQNGFYVVVLPHALLHVDVHVYVDHYPTILSVLVVTS